MASHYCRMSVAPPSPVLSRWLRLVQVPLFPFVPAVSVAINTFLLGQLVRTCSANGWPNM
jgi:hypothetical protein